MAQPQQRRVTRQSVAPRDGNAVEDRLCRIEERFEYMAIREDLQNLQVDLLKTMIGLFKWGVGITVATASAVVGAIALLLRAGV